MHKGVFLATLACASACMGRAVVPDPRTAANAPPERAAAAAAAPPASGGGPATAALQGLEGRVPLVYVAHGPWSDDEPNEPSYELALFDDGTVAYEGHRCVKVGGLVLQRLDTAVVGRVRDLLAQGCAGIDTITENELCGDSSRLRVTCSNGREVLTGSDRCARTEDRGKRLGALASGVLELVGADALLGAPTERQACDAGASDLGPGELGRTLAPHRARHKALTWE
jgi:hypothetical protein